MEGSTVVCSVFKWLPKWHVLQFRSLCCCSSLPPLQLQQLLQPARGRRLARDVNMGCNKMLSRLTYPVVSDEDRLGVFVITILLYCTVSVFKPPDTHTQTTHMSLTFCRGVWNVYALFTSTGCIPRVFFVFTCNNMWLFSLCLLHCMVTAIIIISLWLYYWCH